MTALKQMWPDQEMQRRRTKKIYLKNIEAITEELRMIVLGELLSNALAKIE